MNGSDRSFRLIVLLISLSLPLTLSLSLSLALSLDLFYAMILLEWLTFLHMYRLEYIQSRIHCWVKNFFIVYKILASIGICPTLSGMRHDFMTLFFELTSLIIFSLGSNLDILKLRRLNLYFLKVLCVLKWFFVTFLNRFLTNYIFHMLDFGFLILIINIVAITGAANNKLSTFSINFGYHLIGLGNRWIPCSLRIAARDPTPIGAWGARFLLLYCCLILSHLHTIGVLWEVYVLSPNGTFRRCATTTGVLRISIREIRESRYLLVKWPILHLLGHWLTFVVFVLSPSAYSAGWWLTIVIDILGSKIYFGLRRILLLILLLG